jgi:hypothetical protein
MYGNTTSTAKEKSRPEGNRSRIRRKKKQQSKEILIVLADQLIIPMI